MAANEADGHRVRESAPRRRSGRSWYWLLLLPFGGLLYPPLYSHTSPHLFGFPFFYWYQAVWLAVTAVITTFVFRRTRK
jgi:hypothetical protein